MPTQPISSHNYRPRLDLQALERCLVSVGWPFWLNSARGGFHHVPDKSTFPAPNPITTLPTNVSSAQLNHQVEKLVRCPYEIWCKVSKSSPSFHPSAIDTAVEHIMIRRSWHSVPYALWLDVPKTLPLSRRTVASQTVAIEVTDPAQARHLTMPPSITLMAALGHQQESAHGHKRPYA